MNPRKIAVLCLATVLLSAGGTAFAKRADLPDVTEDGLHRVPDSKMALVYAEPEATLADYHRVKLLEPYVAFKKNWERDQRTTGSMIRISSADIQKIKEDLATEFQQVFRQTLEDGGYEVVDEVADDVLLVRPAIINLNVNAPDQRSSLNVKTYTESAGEMTLYVELYDSVTGDLLAKALDRRIDNTRMGYYTWTNSVTNRAAALKILQGWAQILLDALNEAKQ
jgi:hypothetical protein